MQKVNFYFLSDSSGETVMSVGYAAIAQFDNVEVEKYLWPMVRTKKQIDDLVADASKNDGIVLYTIADDNLRDYLKAECHKHKVRCISAISHVIVELMEHLGIKASRHISGIKHLNPGDEYFERIEAINFTMSHDDGQNLHDINDADIVLIGVSRSSKTPTCFYLAQRGFKVANIPFVKGIGIRIDIEEIKGPTIIGLHITPERLRQIRTSRLVTMTDNTFGSNYTEQSSILEEIKELRQLFGKAKLPVIDVTGKAIEETAAEIINIHYEKIGKRVRLGW